MSRYHVSSNEGQYEKNSREQVLANKQGSAASSEIDEAELVLLEQLYQSVFEELFPEGQLSVALLKSWHRRWLGNIYEWVGINVNTARWVVLFLWSLVNVVHSGWKVIAVTAILRNSKIVR